MLDEGLRIVAIAYKTYSIDTQAEEKYISTNLTFLGLVGMQDALRDGLSKTIDTIKQTGLQVIMATGDHHQTARYVAEEANIFHAGDEVLEGEDFRTLNTQEISKRLTNTTVLSRVTPQEKLEVVNALHANNKIVAMTASR